jgi:carboxylesterase type B
MTDKAITATPTVAYYFTHPGPGAGSATFGAFHSAEISYVVNSPKASLDRPKRASAAT